MQLSQIRLGDKDITEGAPNAGDVSASFSRGFGTVLDSGTTFIYLPSLALAAFKATLQAALPEQHGLGSLLHPRQIAGPDPAFADVCYDLTGASMSTLQSVYPNMTLVFADASLTLPPENYLFAWGDAKPSAFCLGVFDHGDSGVLLGAIAVRDVLITYDRAGGRVGFRQTSCTRLMERLMRS